MGITRLFHGGRQKTTTRQLIDFRGYPSPQLELELSWQVGAKVDQKKVTQKSDFTAKIDRKQSPELKPK